jgi:V-type H+-transporting ATPase subunit d
MKNITVLENEQYTQLYRDVLIDSPVGPYFARFIEQAGENKDLKDIEQALKENSPEQIRTTLKRMWLEEFFEYASTKLNSASSDMLVDLLKFEADFRTIQVVYNSLSSKGLQVNIITKRN